MDDATLHALDGAVRPVRKPPLYFLGLLVVSVAMIILPLIYLALIVAVAYLVVLHATESLPHVGKVGGIYGFLIGYLGPIFVGLVVLFFMIKPLLFSAPKGPEPYTLDPEKQPRLFAFVGRLSGLVGAPKPARIQVDLNVNASASIRRVPGYLLVSDLVLIIGLPLAEGISLRQLSGVLAHELGHFSQGGGMRLSYFIRRINGWFARVVYERDHFDLKLEGATRGGDVSWTKVVAGMAKGGVWLSRAILWVLMTAGHTISCFLMRQMEYDADRYEARVAGSAEFERVARRILVLTVGHAAAMEDLYRMWRQHKLPEQMPGFVVATANQVGQESENELWVQRLSARTGWRDTHPSDADRIKNALAENEKGLIKADLPGTALFDDYDEVAKTVTRTYYTDIVGIEVSADNLLPTERVLAERKQAADRYAALGRFFQGRLSPTVPAFLSVGRVDVHPDAGALRASIGELRKKICETPPDKTAEQKALLRDRLYHSLQLLKSADITEAAQGAEQALDLEIIDQKVAFLYQFEQRFYTIRKLQLHFEGMVNLLQSFQVMNEDENYRRQLVQKVKSCTSDLQKLQEALQDLPYPYEHAKQGCSCAEYAIPHLPDGMNLDGVVDACGCCLDYLFSLYYKVLADLAAAAEQAERMAGFEPLPAPPPPEQAADAAGE